MAWNRPPSDESRLSMIELANRAGDSPCDAAQKTCIRELALPPRHNLGMPRATAQKKAPLHVVTG